MVYQIYHLHLTDGSTIEVSENYDLPAKDGLVEKFRTAAPNELFEIGDALTGFSYIPKSSIVYLSTGDVKTI